MLGPWADPWVSRGRGLRAGSNGSPWSPGQQTGTTEHRPGQAYQPCGVLARAGPVRSVRPGVSFVPVAGRSVRSGQPVRAHPDAHLEGDGQLVRPAHPGGDDLPQPLLLARSHIEHQLVVHLEQHA